jgi:hypothetical protein
MEQQAQETLLAAISAMFQGHKFGTTTVAKAGLVFWRIYLDDEQLVQLTRSAHTPFSSDEIYRMGTPLIQLIRTTLEIKAEASA